MAKFYQGSQEDLFFLATRLKAGELVAVPTETVYGLAANALDPVACARVFEVKGRPSYDPLIVHLANREAADTIAEFNEPANLLAARFWPGALTLILPRKPTVPDIVTAGRPTVAVRVPSHPLMHALLETCGLPLAAPSANRFGSISPTTAGHVEAGLGNHIASILDGGSCEIGLESTIVDVRDPGSPVILRPGGTPREALEKVLQRQVPVYRRKAPPANEPHGLEGELAPGMLDRHYSPRTPVVLRDQPFASEDATAIPPEVARVWMARPKNVPAATADRVFWLSENGDPAHIARRLFELMHELDQAGFERLEFEPAPPSDLGLAINDRLRRAAAR